MKKYGIVALVFSFLDKKRFVLGLILSLASAGLGLLVPQAIGNLLDSQFLVQLLKSPIQLIVLVAFLIATYCLQAVAGYLIGQSGSAAVEKLQGYLHDSLLSASVQSIEDYSAGDLASRLTSDVSVVLTTVAGLFPKLLLNSVIVMGSIYFLFQISVPLTMSSLFLLPLLALVFIPINQRLEAHYGAYQGKMGEVSGRISHRLTTIRLIKAFQGEKDEQVSMTAALSSLQTSFRRIIGWTVFQSSLVNSVMMLFILFQLLVAGQAVANGQMTTATLTTFVLYLYDAINWSSSRSV